MDEILSKCYALRAGLSAISVEKDEIDDMVNGAEERIENYTNEIENKNNEKSAELSNRWKHIHHGRSIGYFFAIVGVGLAILGLLALAIYLWHLNIKDFIYYNRNDAWTPSIIAVAVFAVFLALLPTGALVPTIMWLCELVGALRDSKKENAEIKEIKRNAPYKIEKLKGEILELETKISDAETQLVEWTNSKNGEITEKAKNCELIYQVLEKEFGTFLNPHDWEHLDLLIFYLETGRALSLKEGLQLVDQQVQNDRIIEAIYDVGEGICNTINLGFERLENGLVQCFSVLSTQLNAIQQQQNAQLMNLIQTTNMNNALLAKANENSMELMRDVGYVRSVARNTNVILDEIQMRRRNNEEEF